MPVRYYHVEDYPQFIDVYNILSGKAASNAQYLSIDDDVASNLQHNEALSQPFLLDVLNRFLKPNNRLVNTGKSRLSSILHGDLQSEKNHYACVNHALFFINRYMLNESAEVSLRNYADQMYLIKSLIYNFLYEMRLTETKVSKGLEYIEQRYNTDYKRFRIEHFNNDKLFKICSQDPCVISDLNESNLKIIIESKSTEIIELVDEQDKMRRKIIKLEVQLHAKRKEESALKISHHNLRLRYNECMRQITELVMTPNETLVNFAEIHEEKAALKAQNETLEIENSGLKEELSDLKVQVLRLKDQSARDNSEDRRPGKQTMFQRV